MKKIIFSCFSLFLSITFLLSCTKSIGDSPHPGQRISSLIGITWGLISAKSIDSLSSGTLHTYKGTTADSLFFLWRIDPNIDIFAVNYSIAGVSTQSNASYSVCNWGIFSPIDTSTIKYDTIISSTLWRMNYSDTLFITKVSSNAFVFQVRYSDINGSGVEVDSFYKIRYNYNLY